MDAPARTDGLTDPAPAATGGGGVPEDVRRRVDEAAAEIKWAEPKWSECLCFVDGEQYVEVSAIDGRLDRMEVRNGTTKPRHRVRLRSSRARLRSR